MTTIDQFCQLEKSSSCFGKEGVLRQIRPGTDDHALTTLSELVTDSVLVMPGDGAQIEIVRLVFYGPIVTVAVCIMGEQNKREIEVCKGTCRIL